MQELTYSKNGKNNSVDFEYETKKRRLHSVIDKCHQSKNYSESNYKEIKGQFQSPLMFEDSEMQSPEHVKKRKEPINKKNKTQIDEDLQSRCVESKTKNCDSSMKSHKKNKFQSKSEYTVPVKIETITDEENIHNCVSKKRKVVNEFTNCTGNSVIDITGHQNQKRKKKKRKNHDEKHSEDMSLEDSIQDCDDQSFKKSNTTFEEVETNISSADALPKKKKKKKRKINDEHMETSDTNPDLLKIDRKNLKRHKINVSDANIQINKNIDNEIGRSFSDDSAINCSTPKKRKKHKNKHSDSSDIRDIYVNVTVSTGFQQSKQRSQSPCIVKKKKRKHLEPDMNSVNTNAIDEHTDSKTHLSSIEANSMHESVSGINVNEEIKRENMVKSLIDAFKDTSSHYSIDVTETETGKPNIKTEEESSIYSSANSYSSERVRKKKKKSAVIVKTENTNNSSFEMNDGSQIFCYEEGSERTEYVADNLKFEEFCDNSIDIKEHSLLEILSGESRDSKSEYNGSRTRGHITEKENDISDLGNQKIKKRKKEKHKIVSDIVCYEENVGTEAENTVSSRKLKKSKKRKKNERGKEPRTEDISAENSILADAEGKDTAILCDGTKKKKKRKSVTASVYDEDGNTRKEDDDLKKLNSISENTTECSSVTDVEDSNTKKSSKGTQGAKKKKKREPVTVNVLDKDASTEKEDDDYEKVKMWYNSTKSSSLMDMEEFYISSEEIKDLNDSGAKKKRKKKKNVSTETDDSDSGCCEKVKKTMWDSSSDNASVIDVEESEVKTKPFEEINVKCEVSDELDVKNRIRKIDVEEDEISQEDTLKLKNLKIMIDFEIPELHTILTRCTGVTKEQRETIKLAKIPMKTGNFSKSEDKIIKENWYRFIQIHELDDKPQLFFSFFKKDVGLSLHPNEKRNFLLHLARNLNDRPLSGVYRRFKRLFQAGQVKQGRFTKKEDKLILDYIKTTTSRTPKVDLAKMLNRTSLSIEKRIYLLTRDKYNKTIRWNRKRMCIFLHFLLRVTKCTTVEELKDREITTSEWNKMSKKLDGVPVKRLRCAWAVAIYPRLFIDEDVALETVKTKLVEMMYQNKEDDWRTIEWKKYASNFEGFTAEKMYQLFKNLVNTTVPKEKRTSLKRCLKYLHKFENSFPHRKIMLKKFKYNDEDLETMLRKR